MPPAAVVDHVLSALGSYVEQLRSDGPMSHRPPRAGPRLDCRLPARHGERHEAVVLDVSAAGLRLRGQQMASTAGVVTMVLAHPTEAHLEVSARVIWSRPVETDQWDTGMAFVGFDDRPPEAIVRFFRTHPGLHAETGPDVGPPILVAAAAGTVRKAWLLTLTEEGVALACRHPLEGDVDLTAQHLRVSGTVTGSTPLTPEFHRVDVRLPPASRSLFETL
ncbi:MAG TPA: PilZ domain-containing protein [Candidatus Xenobia bacterium]|jgi:hypothetical protein